ncbi:hypothetical protein DSCA_50550 [Desulfosarcina alkanivorans]|uniref:Sigma-54 factor interaction domain-containing protein n=1 Tax=Desulfosarcina alkanivorans TaxID=571177 RepID=A0A5K7YRZ3_9BACT|nr:sigma 54-interacting transcriptional regulator [Desulfosarcina alkanivorans]BBO71125.1 hypothetical protein DSCA_50550 [Desulfosarcina alkanivorans]
MKKVSEELIDFIDNKEMSGTSKCMTIANISHHAQYCHKPEYLLDAAARCGEIGATEAATAYYLLILENSDETKLPINEEYRETYAKAALGIVSSHGHKIPLERQRSFLSRAIGYLKGQDTEDSLCRLELRLAQVAKGEGLYEEAETLNNRAWDRAKKLNDEGFLREAALFTSDFLFWQGRIIEAVTRYEEAVGDLEKLPIDAQTLLGCATLGWCYGISGQTARGISLIESVQKKAKEHDLSNVIRYADIMSVLTLFDSGRIKEAEIILNHFFTTPEEDLGNYELWAGYASKAFILYHKNEVEGCFEYQVKAYEKSKDIGWFHHRGPWNFEYMEWLEERGFLHPEMNYNSEIKRLINWPDIYMKGVGLKYQARRMIKDKKDIRSVLAVIEESIALLTESGARIELSHAQVLKAQICLKTGKSTEASLLLNEAWLVFSGINPELFPEHLLPYIEENQTEEFLLGIISEVGHTIGTVQDHNQLLERIINLVLKLTKAGRGGIFLKGEDDILRLMAGRNLDISHLNSEEFSSSYQMVKSVFKNGIEKIKKDGPLFHEERKGWQMAYPVNHHEALLGVIYLDNNLIFGAPTKECLFAMKIIAGQLAIALKNAEAYREIARLKERLEDETLFYRKEFEAQPFAGEIVGESTSIQKVLSQIQKVGPTDSTVLILGETGVGKELVAKAIHRSSNRRTGPFIPINSAALDPGLIASELFGHEKGAFTGASKQRRGRFELADGGTLFLDDIDTLSLDIQAKILRAIQEKQFERVGGDKAIFSDFRLLAATNQDLEAMIKNGRFRQDLYFRLNVFPIKIPPLRKRKEDIPILSMYFLNELNRKFGRNIKGLTKQQVSQLTDYRWVGNIRELKHVIERAIILSDGKKIKLPILESDANEETDADDNVILPMQDMERQHILRALKASGGRVSGVQGAAAKLEMKPPTLYAKIRKLGIKKNYSG